MSDQNTAIETAHQKLLEFRRVVGNVITELKSQEVRDTYASITLTEVIDQHLKDLTGTGRIPSRKQRLTRVYEEFKANLQAIKDTDPAAFRQPDPKRDVNTPQ